MYNNNILNVQESTTILNACTKKSGNLLNAPRTCIFFKTTRNGLFDFYNYTETMRGGPRSIVVNVLDCDIVINEFELQSRHYVHFWTNTLGKCMNPLITPVMD